MSFASKFLNRNPVTYSALPSSPASDMSFASPVTPSTPTGGRRFPSPTSARLRPSPFPSQSRFRLRPLHVFLALALLAVLSAPLLHPRPRAIVHDYVSEYLSSKYVVDNLPSHIPAPSGQIPDSLNVPLTLEARLSYLLSRPALWQWEAELPSRHACPFYTYNRNTYFFHEGKPEQWEKVSPQDVRRYRQKLVDYLRAVERDGGKLVWKDGMDAHVPVSQRRGIILTAGDGKNLERLKLGLHMLRNVLNCKLPIQLYHFDDELQDATIREDLEDEYAVDIKEVTGRGHGDKAWNIKNIAFLKTEFTEFIYLDSDNIPLADPALLFDTVEYQQSGSVFWADLNKDHPDNAIFRIMGRDCSDEHWPAETGQMIFDKRGNNGLNLAILHLSNHMMTESDMYGFLSYGDKDTFRFSFYALGLPYQMAPRLFASAGGYQTEHGDGSDEFCERNNADYHPTPAFLHTILAKHRQKLQADKLFSHILRPRLDGILEPRLVRTYYEWTGACFAITLKGPDGSPGNENSMMDGQGVIYQEMRELLGAGTLWDELRTIADKYVTINRQP